MVRRGASGWKDSSDERVFELTERIELPSQRGERAVPGEADADLGGAHVVLLAPVGATAELPAKRLEGVEVHRPVGVLADVGAQLAGIAPVAWAHAQLVRGDEAHFDDEADLDAQTSGDTRSATP